MCVTLRDGQKAVAAACRPVVYDCLATNHNNQTPFVTDPSQPTPPHFVAGRVSIDLFSFMHLTYIKTHIHSIDANVLYDSYGSEIPRITSDKKADDTRNSSQGGGFDKEQRTLCSCDASKKKSDIHHVYEDPARVAAAGEESYTYYSDVI